MFTDDRRSFFKRRQSNPLALVVVGLCVGAAAVYVNEQLIKHRQKSEPPRTHVRPPAASPDPERYVQPSYVEPSSPAAPFRALPAPASRITIYLCKSYEGGTFWSNTLCSSQRATIDRMTEVPASLSFDQQVAIARGAANEAAALYSVEAQTAPAVIGGTGQAAASQSECPFLNEQLRQLDSWARAPHSGQEQDVIRRQRMQLMNRRSTLRC